jgi:hypothetical protein
MTRARQLGEPGRARGPVRLKIERLVLHGFPSGDRRSIAEGVQTELARLMTEHHPLRSLNKPLALERSDGGTIRIGAGAGSRVTARQIAHAVYRSLQAGTAPAQGLPLMRPGGRGNEGRR